MVCVGYSNNTVDSFDYKRNDNKLHCIVLSLFYFMSKMSEMCTMCTNYNVDSNTKYLNYIELQIKCSNYNKLQINSLNYNRV